MAKINHNNFIDTVDSVFQDAKKEGVLHLYAQDKKLTGRTLKIDGQDLLHFGTTGYLGLEQDERLKEAARSAISDYGTQFPLSKSYISHPLYAELEQKVHQMYGIAPIITKNSTLGHLAVLPTLVRDEDAVILDHQVHWSVQSACQQLKLRGIPVEMIRHSNLEMLEHSIRKLMGKRRHIYYMADGVYSMYGDYAPVKELLALGEKYPQLRLYFDDVHGMSWKGKNGTGFIFEQLGTLPHNVFVVSTLSKTFGASGATFFTSDNSLRDKIRTFGGPLTFSAQLEPASVAAAIASADIHLTPEILIMQQRLAEKIDLFNNLLLSSHVPMVSHNDSPVFFLAMGTPATGYSFTKKLFADGFYLNLGIYPAVPIRNTGIRVTLSKHNSKTDIKALSQALEFHYNKALEETGTTEAAVRKSFGMPTMPEEPRAMPDNGQLVLEERHTIEQLSEREWNTYMADRNIIDWLGMRYLEDSFVAHPDPEHRFEFYYFTVRDRKGVPVLMTFFTHGLWKDDMLSSESVSRQLEKARIQDPHHLTSMVLSMGSLFTEGDHCYIDSEHPESRAALCMLLEKVQEKFELLEADLIVLRDFDRQNIYDSTIRDQGYFQVDMPESCTLTLDSESSSSNVVSGLSVRSKRHFRQEIAPFMDRYDVVIKDDLDPSATEAVHRLYKNVNANNLALNNFAYPISVFERMVRHENWEFILLYLKSHPGSLVGVMFCYKSSSGSYVPELIGMDYEIGREHGLYRQLLYQTILRAKELGAHRIDLGVTAAFEKKKLGAECRAKVAYVQARDNFKLELLQTLQNDNA